MQPVTRELAESLVCPFMSTTQLVTYFENGSTNAEDQYTLNRKCITTKCMAWEVCSTFTIDEFGHEDVEYDSSRHKNLKYSPDWSYSHELHNNKIRFKKKTQLEPLQCTGSCMRLKG